MSSQQYYADSARHGEYQYVSLKDIINNFMLMNVGDDKIINDIPRYQVLHHAKRGIQELSYDALKETQKLEFELGSSLKIVMPEDFVQLVKASILDKYGRLHPLIKNTENALPDAFLQDSSSDYTFDDNGNRQQTDSISNTIMSSSHLEVDVDALEDEHTGGRFGMDTASANKNGTYLVDKKAGFVKFSSHLTEGDIVILEYVSDGLFGTTDDQIKINKLAEDYMYSYLQSEILDRKFGVQEYIVRRYKKSTSAKLRNAKIKLMNINIDDLVQRLRGKDKWIK